MYVVEATEYFLSSFVREYLTIKRLNDFYYYLFINQIITISELTVRLFFLSGMRFPHNVVLTFIDQ